MHGIRDATRDVGSAERLDEELRSAVARVAARHGLAPKWLNDSAAGFLPATFALGDREVLLDRPTLRVLGAPLDQAFLMKLFASRAADTEDLEALWPFCSFQSPEAAAEAFYEAYPVEDSCGPTVSVRGRRRTSETAVRLAAFRPLQEILVPVSGLARPYCSGRVSTRTRTRRNEMVLLQLVDRIAGVRVSRVSGWIGVLADDVNVTPTGEGAPGQALISQLLNWLGQYALWASLAAILAGGAVWGLAERMGSAHHAGKGKGLVLGGAVGAIITGLAATIVNTLFAGANP